MRIERELSPVREHTVGFRNRRRPYEVAVAGLGRVAGGANQGVLGFLYTEIPATVAVRGFRESRHP